MGKNWYVIFIVLAAGLICLSFILVSRRNKRISHEMIEKSRSEKQVQIEEKIQPDNQIEKEENQKEQNDANLENFVLESEEENKAEQFEEEFDYKKFVDENIEALDRYNNNFGEMHDIEGIKDFKQKLNNDILSSILFGNKNSDED